MSATTPPPPLPRDSDSPSLEAIFGSVIAIVAFIVGLCFIADRWRKYQVKKKSGDADTFADAKEIHGTGGVKADSSMLPSYFLPMQALRVDAKTFLYRECSAA
jgi:hypothetical protein